VQRAGQHAQREHPLPHARLKVTLARRGDAQHVHEVAKVVVERSAYRDRRRAAGVRQHDAPALHAEQVGHASEEYAVSALESRHGVQGAPREVFERHRWRCPAGARKEAKRVLNQTSTVAWPPADSCDRQTAQSNQRSNKAHTESVTVCSYRTFRVVAYALGYIGAIGSSNPVLENTSQSFGGGANLAPLASERRMRVWHEAKDH
jgi:hypothetical protein